MNPNRRPDRRFWQVLAALAGLLLLWAVVTCLLLLSGRWEKPLPLRCWDGLEFQESA